MVHLAAQAPMQISTTTTYNSALAYMHSPGVKPPTLESIKKSAGFTLIEILVTASIIAILAGTLIVNVRLPTGTSTQHEAMRLAALARIAAEKAVLESASYGIHFSQQGYTFYVLRPADDATESAAAKWRVADDSRLGEHLWPESLTHTLQIESQSVSLLDPPSPKEDDPFATAEDNDWHPHWLFFTNGESFPDVEIDFSGPANEKWQVIIGERGLPLAQRIP